jgi:hypothetical protein
LENESHLYRIHAGLAPCVNLAFYENSVPVLRELTVINDGEDQDIREMFDVRVHDDTEALNEDIITEIEQDMQRDYERSNTKKV